MAQNDKWWSMSVYCPMSRGDKRWVNRYQNYAYATARADEERAGGCRAEIREGRHYEPFVGRSRRRRKNKRSR
jgi:hypothetical protein